MRPFNCHDNCHEFSGFQCHDCVASQVPLGWGLTCSWDQGTQELCSFPGAGGKNSLFIPYLAGPVHLICCWKAEVSIPCWWSRMDASLGFHSSHPPTYTRSVNSNGLMTTPGKWPSGRRPLILVFLSPTSWDLTVKSRWSCQGQQHSNSSVHVRHPYSILGEPFVLTPCVSVPSSLFWPFIVDWLPYSRQKTSARPMTPLSLGPLICSHRAPSTGEHHAAPCLAGWGGCVSSANGAGKVGHPQVEN